MASSTRNERVGGAYEAWKAGQAHDKSPAHGKGTGRKSIAKVREVSNSLCQVKQCNVCARYHLHRPNCYSAIFNYDDGCIDSNGNYLNDMNRLVAFERNERGLDHMDRPKVDEALALQTADAAEMYLEALRSEMIDRGLLQREDQNFSGECKRARIVAPIHPAEIQLGALLGVGGFSAVLDVAALTLDKSISDTVSDACEQLSREFLARNTLRYPDNPGTDKIDDESVVLKTNTNWRKAETPTPEPRYALKHLRHNLAKDPEKYQRACVDLVLEGQLLLAMDHPNIIGIRGWPMFGTDAIRSGILSDYFLILDRLPETLEQRMWTWRKSLRKYKARCGFPLFQSQKYLPKIEQLFQKRLHVATCIASAIEYMHSKRIIHRDIKSANMGFDVRGDLKLFDFGLSRILPDSSDSCDEELLVDEYCMSRVGTKFYMAPEVKSKEPYGLPADVFSVGVLFWELFSLASPRVVYNDKKRHRRPDVTQAQERSMAINCNRRSRVDKNEVEEAADPQSVLGAGWLPICPCWPKAIQSIILSCLREKPESRPTISETQENLVYLRLHSPSDDGRTDDERRRRRTTFRLDLSSFQAAMGPRMAFEASGESKTSVSSFDFGLITGLED